MTEPKPHILVENLTMAYGDFVIQQDLNFSINRGDIFIIMGGSGCGKSTLLRILVGLKAPSRGQVFYEGIVSVSNFFMETVLPVAFGRMKAVQGLSKAALTIEDTALG